VIPPMTSSTAIAAWTFGPARRAVIFLTANLLRSLKSDLGSDLTCCFRVLINWSDPDLSARIFVSPLKGSSPDLRAPLVARSSMRDRLLFAGPICFK
jgi:hypothetical protein